jgi:hypothetical protein
MANRVRKDHLVLGVGRVLAARGQLRQVRAGQFLPPGLARGQHVQAHPRDDRGQPGGQVLRVAGVRAAQPQP